MIEIPHTVKASDIAQHMKGRSSFETRKRWGWLRQCRAFWQKRYFCCSVGPRSRARVRRYLENQNGD
jgi:REP element-mobilizing transposase RayT